MNECLHVINEGIEIEFMGWKEHQKELIEFILKVSNLNLNQLAEVIEEDLEIIHKVVDGKFFLSNQSLINLNQLIYMFSTSCDLEH